MQKVIFLLESKCLRKLQCQKSYRKANVSRGLSTNQRSGTTLQSASWRHHRLHSGEVSPRMRRSVSNMRVVRSWDVDEQISVPFHFTRTSFYKLGCSAANDSNQWTPSVSMVFVALPFLMQTRQWTLSVFWGSDFTSYVTNVHNHRFKTTQSQTLLWGSLRISYTYPVRSDHC